MEFDPQDQNIVKLLTKLKGVGGSYPEHMLAARRQSYLARIAEIEMGLNAGKGSANPPKNGGGGAPNPAPVTSTILETALVVTMIVEASAVAYFYRDKFTNLFETTTSGPRVQEVTPPPVVTSALEVAGVSPSPAVTVTLPSLTLDVSASPSIIPVTASNTPIPGVADNNTNTTNNTTSTGADQSKSTPVPNVSNGDQGNHYGQTPKPERTKDPGSNQGSNNNTAPKDQSKPTKSK
jgi:hypothetical protein